MTRVRILPAAVWLALFALILGCGRKVDLDGESGASSGPSSVPASDSEKPEAKNRLVHIGIALHSHHDAYQTLPAGIVGPNKQLGLSWRVAILPYLEEDALYKEFKLDEPWDSEHNKKLIDKMPKVFASPDKYAGKGMTYLRSFAGPMAFIPAPRVTAKGAPQFNPWANTPPGQPARGRRFADFADGTSNTIIVVEAAEPVEWTKPDDLPFPDDFANMPGAPKAKPTPLPKLGGVFAGGFHALRADGSVSFIPKELSETGLRALITINGGEILSKEDMRLLYPPRDDEKPSATESVDEAKKKAKW